MDKESFTKYAIEESSDQVMQEVLEILDADDGRSFEEKKEALLMHLQERRDAELAEVLANCAIADKTGQQVKAEFWSFGIVVCPDASISLRDVYEGDREVFLSIQQENSPLKEMMKEQVCCDMAWKEHLGDKSLMLSIEKDGTYIGYCGIKNMAQNPWEIAIEIQSDWTRNGIGPIVITAMLNAIKARLNITDFRVRIDPGNRSSQKMFERLGAIPNGISEYLVHDPEIIQQCEENNLHLIDEDTVALAKKFGVEPHKLLSHILEYTLNWS